jgi:hypothetical protein
MSEDQHKIERKPGTAIPWEEKVKELPPIESKPELVKKVWEDNDSLAYTFAWQMLLSF